MKKTGKVKKGLCIATSCVFLVFLSGTWFLCYLRILPCTRKWFISYGSFYKKTDDVMNFYPEKLPSSAGNIRYFYYTGYLDTKTGISFTLSEEEGLEYSGKKTEHEKKPHFRATSFRGV